MLEIFHSVAADESQCTLQAFLDLSRTGSKIPWATGKPLDRKLLYELKQVERDMSVRDTLRVAKRCSFMRLSSVNRIS